MALSFFVQKLKENKRDMMMKLMICWKKYFFRDGWNEMKL